MNKEPIEDLLKLNACLKAIVDEPKLIIETVDKDYRKFFFEDMAVGALKRLSLEKSRDEKVSTLEIYKPFLRDNISDIPIWKEKKFYLPNDCMIL